jgi:hypothetical protein
MTSMSESEDAWANGLLEATMEVDFTTNPSPHASGRDNSVMLFAASARRYTDAEWTMQAEEP